jgi:hypothetical protein
MSESAYDLAIIGSGPAASLAALRAVSQGFRTLMLERAQPALERPRFDFDRTSRALDHAGVFAPTPPSRTALALPAVLGGGFAVNSGFYRWPSPEQISALEPHVSATELNSARLWVESHLPLQCDPPTPSAAHLARTAAHLALNSTSVPTWLHPQFAPTGPFLPLALAAGLVLRTSAEVKRISRSGALRQLHLLDGSTVSARAVLLAAGPFGSFALAASSGLVPTSTTLAAHPMFRSMLLPTLLDSTPQAIGNIQVSHGSELVSGCGLAEPWSLAAAHPEVIDRIERSFSQGIRPYGWYTQATHPKAFKLQVSRRGLSVRQIYSLQEQVFLRAARAHLNLLEAADLPWFFAGSRHVPKSYLEVLKNPRVSVVHFTSSLPLGDVLGPDGSFRTDPMVGCCDSSTLPTAPGVNPQALTMSLSSTLVDRFLSSRSGGL